MFATSSVLWNVRAFRAWIRLFWKKISSTSWASSISYLSKNVRSHRNNQFHISNIQNVRLIFFSWFMETVELYSPFVVTLLICSLMMLACSVFQLDLVNIVFDLFFIKFRSLLLNNFIPGSQTCWSYTWRPFNSSIIWYYLFVYVLLFWKNGYRKLWTNVWHSIWMHLVRISYWYTEKYSIHDFE